MITNLVMDDELVRMFLEKHELWETFLRYRDEGRINAGLARQASGKTAPRDITWFMSILVNETFCVAVGFEGKEDPADNGYLLYEAAPPTENDVEQIAALVGGLTGNLDEVRETIYTTPDLLEVLTGSSGSSFVH